MAAQTADEVFDEVLTPQQRLDILRGRPVIVQLTREQHDIIEADPVRAAFRAFTQAAIASLP